MKSTLRYLCAFLLVLVCLPAVADDCAAIRSFSANDSQTGEPVTLQWSYTGGAPQTQTLTGHDFETPVLLGPDDRSFTYMPSKPGEKHAQLAAVTGCGTVSTATKYHVKQCNVVAPAITVDQTSVEPGAVINASIDLKPGHTVRWEVTNGTASSTSAPSIQVTAGGSGTVVINAWVSRGSSCAVLSSASVQVVQACPIQEPQVYHPQVATADNWFYLYVPSAGPGETYTFEVRGAQVEFVDEWSVNFVAPSQGTFSIDLIVTNGTCTRTFTYTFTVQACQATATVRPGGTGECGATTAVVEFTGTAPWQGEWSDGQYFFSWEPTLERPISGGTYSLNWVYDQYCFGTVSGSATAGASLPVPVYTIDEIVDGGYWGRDTCPGTVRTATLNGAIPEGATLEWTIPGGTIISGQGTPVVQYAGQQVGLTNLTATFRDAQGCASPSYTDPYAHTMGTPQLAVRVEPSTIPAGGTAIVTTEFLSYFTGGSEVTSSLGDTLVWIGNNQYEYRSTNGGGVATITFRANNVCASATATTTLTIDGSNPVQATARVRAIGQDCSSYAVFAEFTGVPPFTGTWSNGETFTTTDAYAYLWPQTGGTYTLTAFSDSNGAGTITGDATFDFVPLPKPVVSFDVAKTCPNGIVTATLDAPLPEGGIATWWINGGELVSGQGTATVQIRAAENGWVSAFVSITAPGKCSPYSDYKDIPIQGYVQQPNFYAYPIYVGGTSTFDVYLDPNTATWNFENTFGDTIEIVGNPQPNVYTLRYTSTHGFGDSVIRIYGTTHCGLSFEATRTINILPPAPTVTLSYEPGASCGANVTATFTGTAPFSGTWWDGQTFTTNEHSITRFLGIESFVYVYNVSDFYGGNAGSGGIYVPVQRPPHIALSGNTQMCLGQQTSVTADLPAGWQIQWRVVRTGPDMDNLFERMRIVSGENSATVVVEGTMEGVGALNPIITTPEGCINYQSFDINVTSCP